MAVPITACIRRSAVFLKAVAVTVTIAFLGLTLQPLAIAANLPARNVPDPRAASNEEKLARTLEDIEQRLARLEEKLAKQEDAAREKTELKALRQELDALDRKALEDFGRIERHLKEKNLPQVILDRHNEAVNTYKQEMATLKANLDELEEAPKDEDKKLRATKAREHLKTKQKKKPHTPVDPNNLPFRVPDAKKTRKPAETKEGFQKLGLIVEPRIQLASTELVGGMLAQALTSALPTAQDLQPTEDVQTTSEIQALAVSLNNNPVQIYKWVRNNIYFVPTYGSIQGSQLCMETKQCNAFDTASLLIALLRAANIPARYVYGTVQIPADKAMNWVGGVNVPDAAQELLGQGGIPSVAVIQGGKVVGFRVEHVWVEAWVDFYPSRGAIHRQGDSWIPMDASFKRYQFTPGMDIKNNVPFDGQGLVSQIQASATINSAEGWVQGINTAAVQNSIDSYQTQVQAYIDGVQPNATVGDVLGDQKIVADNRSVLAASLPYQINAIGSRYAVLPANLRHSLQFAIYASDLDRALNSPSLSYSQSLPALAGKRLALVYEGATAADQSVIDGAVASGATSLPAYLIHVKPVLKVESEPVATGEGATMGDRQTFTITVSSPWHTRARDYRIGAGDFNAVGINAAGITPELYDRRTKMHDLSKGEEPDFAAEMFYQIGLAWWGEKYAFNRTIGDVNHVRTYQLPSHTLVGTPLTVRYFFGIARSAFYASRVVDAKEDLIMAQHTDSNAETRRQFMLAVGQMGSFLEGNIFEQAFLMTPGQAISTVSAWKMSNDQNIPIYTITQANAATALPQIATDADAKAEMANAIAVGLRVTVPKQDISVDNFTGTGYFIEDPLTGAGAYQITGGRSGGSSPAPESVFPMPQTSASPLLGLMIGSTLRSAGMSLAVKNGVIAGVAMPAVDVAVAGTAALVLAAKILAAILLALLLIWGIVQVIDTLFPRIYKRLRHYTRFAQEIEQSMVIYQTKDGTFGAGVYMADAQAEDARGVRCPPNAIDIVTRFQIPRPGEENPAFVTGYVDIAIMRDNLYKIEPKVNSVGQDELVVRFPLIPWYRPDTQTIVPALYFGPFAPGVQFEGACY